MGRDDTTKEQAVSVRRSGAAQPGLVAAFVGGRPFFQAQVVGTTPVRIGRGGNSSWELADEHCSREHAEVSLTDRGWFVRDLGSRNGTFADGESAGAEGRIAHQTVRLGQSVLVLHPDILRLGGPHHLTDPKLVAGPMLLEAFDTIAEYAKHARHLLIVGETGAGKEAAARVFHDRGERPTGPYRVVNTAEISKELWESTLFGHRKGAFTGAQVDKPGLFEAANGGTLFLDEIGELSLEVQPKLLRVLQEGEVLRVGDASPRKVDVRVVAATNRDLHHAVRAGLFREDLYYRLGQNIVGLPPLRDRPEEIPYLIALAVAEFGLPIDAGFVEACLLRLWPGNVRELLGAVRRAAIECRRQNAKTISASRLAPLAGKSLEVGAGDRVAPPTAAPSLASMASARPLSNAEKERAVVEIYQRDPATHPNEVALRLGIDPRTVYRYLERNGIRRVSD